MLSTFNTSNCRGLKIFVALAGLGTAHSVAAQESGEWYGGIGVGNAHIEVYRGTLYGFGAWEAGASDSTLLAYGGYRLTKHFALDVAYLMPTNLEWREDGAYIEDLSTGAYESRTSLSTSAIQLSLVGILPFATRWEAYLKGGISAYESEGTQALTDFFTDEVLYRPLSGSNTGFLLGLGIGVTPKEKLRFRFEYQLFYIDNALINVGPENDPTLDTWMFGIDYRFGEAR